MMFAWPLAAEGSSLALKILITIGIFVGILSIGAYGGARWESTNTLKVQAALDKLVSDTNKAGASQDTKAKLTNQQNTNDMEKANEESDRSRAATKSANDGLQRLKRKGSRAGVMPRASADPESFGLTCFDSEELIGADTTYRAGEASRRDRIYGLIKEGSEAIADLNSAKLWKIDITTP